MAKPTVAIIGLGQVGSALKLVAKKAYEVLAFDTDPSKKATDPSILTKADFIIVCVPTDITKQKKPDLSPLKAASKLIAQNLQAKQAIIIESTVSPGTCEQVILPILQKANKPFYLAHCPERINPGDSKWNITNIPRVIGALTPKGLSKAKKFYQAFVKASITPLSSIRAAEASKIFENTFRDINIAYVNEFAKHCDNINLDVHEIIAAANTKPFGFLAHYPGMGVGGHCIPIDPYYLIASGLKSDFLTLARKINDSMPAYTIQRLKSRIKTLKNARISVLGLAYKPEVSDTRNSPGLKITQLLEKAQAQVQTFDPYTPGTAPSLTAALKHADHLIIATNHKKLLKALTPQKLQQHKIQTIISTPPRP